MNGSLRALSGTLGPFALEVELVEEGWSVSSSGMSPKADMFVLCEQNELTRIGSTRDANE